MVTSELALGLIALAIIVIMALGGIRVATTRSLAQETSREVAVLLAKGRSEQEATARVPEGVEVNIQAKGTYVTVSVSKHITVPFPFTATGQAQVDKEPSYEYE